MGVSPSLLAVAVFIRVESPDGGSFTVTEYVAVTTAPAERVPKEQFIVNALNVQLPAELDTLLLYVASSRTPVRSSSSTTLVSESGPVLVIVTVYVTIWPGTAEVVSALLLISRAAQTLEPTKDISRINFITNDINSFFIQLPLSMYIKLSVFFSIIL